MSTPDWLVPGADVVEFTPSQHTAGGRIERTIITKIGKRDVLLANGNRFNARYLIRRNGEWAPSTYLLPPDDVRVIDARSANLVAHRQAAAIASYEQWRKDRTAENAAHVVTDFQRLMS